MPNGMAQGYTGYVCALWHIGQQVQQLCGLERQLSDELFSLVQML